MNPEVWQSLDIIFATKYNKAKTSWESIVFENYTATLKHECRFLKNYSLKDLNLTEVLQNSKFLPQQNDKF